MTANFTTDFSNTLSGLSLTGSTCNGPGTLVVKPGQTLQLLVSTVSAPLTLEAAWAFSGPEWLVTGTRESPCNSLLQCRGLHAGAGRDWPTAQAAVLKPREGPHVAARPAPGRGDRDERTRGRHPR